MSQWIKLISGPILGTLVSFLLYSNTANYELAATGGVAIWMAVWWILEAISIYFTAFIPIIFFPFLGVTSMNELAPSYMPEIIFFFIGGFLLAFALEKWRLHEKIAYTLIQYLGSSPQRILLGFMTVSYLLSMWILNTAVVMMLIPAALAIVRQFTQKESSRFSTMLLLGIAYAASIGGTATLVGTAPNLYFSDFFNTNFPEYPPITFASWFVVGFPSSLAFVWITYRFLLWKFLDKLPEGDEFQLEFGDPLVTEKLTYEQRVIAVVFSITVLLWFTAKDLDIGNFHFVGWTNLFPFPNFIKESTVAMLAAFLLFVFPAKNEGGNLLDWQSARKIPFGVIFLFGGGFALAKVIGISGLSAWLGESLQFVNGYSPILIVIILATFMTFFTELTSNTASTVLILPILSVLVVNIDFHPLLIMMPVIFSASFAFMLPVATPPNTIVFATEKIRAMDMAKTGLVLNLVGILINIVFVLLWAKWVYSL